MQRDPAGQFFHPSVSERERAVFEGGIALGALYHQFVGTPISSDAKVIKALEQAIEACIRVQPYRERVQVRIDEAALKREGTEPYDYQTLKGRHLTVEITIRYGAAKATVAMRHIPELQFNLMFIKEVTEERS
ncbi:MAG: dihydroneopterin aldolase family protein [Candidatus Bathyarchaeia archaeon]